MNEDEVRNLLGKAASGPVDVDQVDPEAIVRAGRRGAARRQGGIALAGGAAAVLALAAAVGIPMALGGDGEQTASGGAAPEDLPTAPVEDDFLAQWNRADGGDCPVPDGQTDEQQRTAAAYNEAFFAGLAALGAEPLGSCLTTRPDYDGFYYSDDYTSYYVEESVAFGGEDLDWAKVTGSIWETGGVNYESQMESEECDYNAGAICSWVDTEAGRVLLVEGTRSDFVNPDTESGGSVELPVVSAFLFREDVVVALGFSLHFESDLDGPSADQVIELVQSIPVGEQAPEVELPAEGDLADELAGAIANAVPGAVVDTGSAELVRLDADVAEYGGPVYGSEATHMMFVLAELESGETVRFFLQAEPVEGAGEESEEAAASYAQCPDAECDVAVVNPWDISVHRTIAGERPSLTALEYRTGDGWMIGVGVETVDAAVVPPVDFATLDAIVAALH